MPTLNKKFIAGIILALAFIGFADATFLTLERIRNIAPPCTLIAGCDLVTLSKYSSLGGVPLAGIGAGYYLVLIVLAVYFLDSRREFILKFIFYISGLGFLSSLGLVWLQLFDLKAICIYCMVSAVTTTGIFLLSLL